ncbi:tRNA lysidine(34) synthetase TilS [Ekhidna sp.]|uniref:tRNA lysidine(34) synthetase TilS n=1 Tax=Ekhidna sp. TaxID=2608089 RepID=UPI003297F8B0
MKKDEKVLLAVSGGLDSMVMANLFLAVEIPFAIAHCNYGLRGEESDGDEAFVMDWADKNNINCHVKAFDISNGSVQLDARNARYQWFSELISEYGFGKVATAHHLNDSLETLLINLTRGTGIRGIAGISVKNTNVIHPLLFADKKRLHDYAMDQGLEWREDSSNTKTDYDRNLLRHNVVPELLRLNPSLLKTFSLTMERLTYTSEIVEQKVGEVRTRFLLEEGSGFQLDLSWINTQSDELVLAELLVPFGVNYVTAKEIFEARGKAGKSFPVNDWLITMDRSTIFIDKDDMEKTAEIVIDSAGEYSTKEGRFIVEKVAKEDVVFGTSHIAHFDANKLHYPFLIRSWKEGDRFQPLGMKGEKKVSDYLIDEKIPLASKKAVLVLEFKKRIAWLVGKRISEAFKISDASTDFIKITFVKAG